MNDLKLFKKKKEFSSLDNLDIPPAPPPRFSEDLPPAEIGSELPPPPIGAQQDYEWPDLHQELNPPEIPAQKPKKGFSLFQKKKKEEALPELPPINEQPMPELPEMYSPHDGDSIAGVPGPSFEETVQIQPQPAIQPIAEKKQVLAKVQKTEKYLKVDGFQLILSEFNEIKKTVRNAVGIPTDVQDKEKELNREFEAWKATMKDIQRKLLFIDKQLFEGD